LGFGVLGLGFGIWGFGFRVWDFGFWVLGALSVKKQSERGPGGERESETG